MKQIEKSKDLVFTTRGAVLGLISYIVLALIIVAVLLK